MQELEVGGTADQDLDQDRVQVRVVQIGGALYEELLSVAKADCFTAAVQQPNIYLVERKLPSDAEAESRLLPEIGVLYEPDLDMMLVDLRGYTCLQNLTRSLLLMKCMMR